MATAKQSTGSQSKPKKPRKAKTAAELKADLEKAKAAVALLEQKAYAEELGEAVKETKIVNDFNAIKSKIKDVKDVAILAAIGKAVGIARLEITQKPAPKRKPAAK